MRVRGEGCSVGSSLLCVGWIAYFRVSVQSRDCGLDSLLQLLPRTAGHGCGPRTANNMDWLVRFSRMNYISTWRLMLVTQWHTRAPFSPEQCIPGSCVPASSITSAEWDRVHCLLSWIRFSQNFLWICMRDLPLLFSEQQRAPSGIQQPFGRPLILSNGKAQPPYCQIHSTHFQTEDTEILPRFFTSPFQMHLSPFSHN